MKHALEQKKKERLAAKQRLEEEARRVEAINRRKREDEDRKKREVEAKIQREEMLKKQKEDERRKQKEKEHQGMLFCGIVLQQGKLAKSQANEFCLKISWKNKGIRLIKEMSEKLFILVSPIIRFSSTLKM